MILLVGVLLSLKVGRVVGLGLRKSVEGQSVFTYMVDNLVYF